MAQDTVLDGWTESSFTSDGRTKQTFRKGDGPGVIVVHEIPGITPEVAAFADDVAAAGFTVVMPVLCGTPGRPVSTGYMLGTVARVCISREFTTWARNSTSPVISWLRALGRSLHDECGGPGIGAVGMCFSGGFALGLMLDDRMIAPVLSQPSLPFSLGTRRGADLNLSPADLERVKERAAGGCDVIGLRFRDDKLVGTRFDTLRAELGERFVAVELPSPFPRAHSVLTNERDEPSVERVINFLAEKLRSTT
jgi:dienelactone hydrolase